MQWDLTILHGNHLQSFTRQKPSSGRISVSPREKWRGLSMLTRKTKTRGVLKYHTSKRRKPASYQGNSHGEVQTFSAMLPPEQGPLMGSGYWGHTGNVDGSSLTPGANLPQSWVGATALPGQPHPAILIPAWQEQAQMSPDYPTNVVISDKGLIGKRTLSFPLIKECSRKTKMATKHCQHNNQLYSVPSWALCRKQGRLFWFPISVTTGVKEDKAKKRGWSLLHTQSAGLRPPSWGQRQQFVCLFLCSHGGGC